MLLLRFVRAMIGAIVGGVIIKILFYDWSFYRGGTASPIYLFIQYLVFCVIFSIAISSGIALSRKYLQLRLGNLTRFLFGFLLLELLLIVIFLMLPFPRTWKLQTELAMASLQPLIIGGFAGLFYGNISPADQDWRLSKTLVFLYRICNLIIGKRDDEVTSLSLGKKDDLEN